LLALVVIAVVATFVVRALIAPSPRTEARTDATMSRKAARYRSGRSLLFLNPTAMRILLVEDDPDESARAWSKD